MKKFKKIMAGILGLTMVGSFSVMAADSESFAQNWLKRDDWDGSFTVADDGTVSVSDSGWYTQRLYNKEYEGDVTIEMSFTWPEDNIAPWVGVIAHASPVADQPQAIDTFEATYLRVTGSNPGTEKPIAMLQGRKGESEYATSTADGWTGPVGGKEMVVSLECKGTTATAYVDGQEAVKIEDAAVADGKYVGIYASQSNGVVINYVKVNGETILGNDTGTSNPESTPESSTPESSTPESTPESSTPESSNTTTPNTGVGYPLAAVAVVGVSAMGLIVARKVKKK